MLALKPLEPVRLHDAKRPQTWSQLRQTPASLQTCFRSSQSLFDLQVTGGAVSARWHEKVIIAKTKHKMMLVMIHKILNWSMNIQIHHWTSGETGFMHKEWIGNSSLSGFSMVPLYSYVIYWQSYIGIRKPPYANDKFMYYSFVYFSSIRRYLNVLTQLIEGNYCFLISYVLTD